MCTTYVVLWSDSAILCLWIVPVPRKNHRVLRIRYHSFGITNAKPGHDSHRTRSLGALVPCPVWGDFPGKSYLATIFDRSVVVPPPFPLLLLLRKPHFSNGSGSRSCIISIGHAETEDSCGSSWQVALELRNYATKWQVQWMSFLPDERLYKLPNGYPSLLHYYNCAFHQNQTESLTKSFHHEFMLLFIN